MQTLFPIAYSQPEGFVYVPNFISNEEETFLIELINKLELHTFKFQGYEAKRKVANFGFDWNFESRSLSKGKEIPEAFMPLVEKVARHLNREVKNFAELLVTEYDPGTVINWHRDAPPFDFIAGISLLSTCRFRFRPYEKKLQSRKSILSFDVDSKSLYTMQGDARSAWEHSIAPVKTKRYSITLRTLKSTI
jgi:alkylated DNA repair dioxygenase AlkB